MKKILLSSAFPVILLLHVGAKVFFPGLFAYGSSHQQPEVVFTTASLDPAEIFALTQETLVKDDYYASIPGSARTGESPIPTQP